MKSKRRLYWLLQFVGWGGYYLVALSLITSTRFTFTPNLLLWITASVLFSVFLSHLLRGVIVHLKLLSLRFLELFLSTLVFVFIAAVLLEAFQYFLDLIIPNDFMPHLTNQFWLVELFMGTQRSMMLFGIWAFFYYVYILKSAKDNPMPPKQSRKAGY